MIIRRHPVIAWCIVYTLLTVALAFPLVVKLTSTVAGDLVDPLLLSSVLWWNAHVLPLTERWWNGFAFYPSTGMLAFSDHLLGESLIASPLQWLGCSPTTALNLTLLATFPLCAIAAHWLGFVLTRRHDAAAICGLAYGFNPYRLPHIAHMQLLAAFGMPAALAALHMALMSRRWRWVVVFGAAFLIQSLCTAYYGPFFAVLLVLWVLWFVRWRDRWLLAGMLAVGIASAAVLLPLAIEYARIHHAYGFFRGFEEILIFSPDMTSVLTASGNSVLWAWTSGLNGGEAQTFPGFFVTVLVAAGITVALRSRRFQANWSSRIAYGLVGVAVIFLGVAFSVKIVGGWRVQAGPLRIMADSFFKPFTVSVALTVLAISCSRRARDAWNRRSPFGFYVVATVFLFLCSFGPKASLVGRQLLYQPPYAWLMHLPFFSNEIRVPARFTMLAVLTLATAGALAFERLRLRESVRTAVAAIVILGVIADGWGRHFPIAALPDTISAARAAPFDAVLEMPAGARDPLAMYRAMTYGRPIVNGYSGYSPPDYSVLAGAVKDRDASVLDAVVETGRLLIAVDHRLDSDDFWRSTLEHSPRARALGVDGPWSFFTAEPPPTHAVCQEPSLPLVRAYDDGGDLNVRFLTDHNADTFWGREHQLAGDGFVLDLGQATAPCAVQLSLGRAAWAFPRALAIDTSSDAANWSTVFNGSTSAEAFRGSLAHPIDAWLTFAIKVDPPVRFIRVRLDASRPKIPWLVADVVVLGSDTYPTPSTARNDGVR